jgi:hypothetical protein
LKRYADVNAVVHSHAEDVLPYTVIDTEVQPTYHMAGFLGPFFFRFPSFSPSLCFACLNACTYVYHLTN